MKIFQTFFDFRVSYIYGLNFRKRFFCENQPEFNFIQGESFQDEKTFNFYIFNGFDDFHRAGGGS